jgi:hypothetical protein
MPEGEDRVSQTKLLRAFEAAVGRADRERLQVAAEAQITSGDRSLWVIDDFQVGIGEVCASLAADSDDLLLPREGLPVTLKFSLKRMSGQTVVKDGGTGDG